MTATDETEARTIGTALVESRLAACANIIPGMKSIYRWEGALQNDTEAVLIAKTRESLVGKLIEKAKSMHSYTIPCIETLPVLDGNPDYLAWVAAETGA